MKPRVRRSAGALGRGAAAEPCPGPAGRGGIGRGRTGWAAARGDGKHGAFTASLLLLFTLKDALGPIPPELPEFAGG